MTPNSLKQHLSYQFTFGNVCTLAEQSPGNVFNLKIIKNKAEKIPVN